MMQMEDGDQGVLWPADMERRRIADLQKFYRNNPDCKVTTQNQRGGQCHGPSAVSTFLSSVTKRGRSTNRWSLETTLELLETMKAFVRANKLCHIGEKNWTAIAMNLSNPQNIELSKLARSSMVKYSNLRRILRGKKCGKLEFEIRRSLAEFIEICGLQQARVSKTSSMVAKYVCHSKESSPSPLSTPATGKYLNHASVSKRKPQRDAYTMLLADDHSCASNDDSVPRPYLGSANSQSISERVKAQSRAQAAESESINQGGTDSSEEVVLRATPTKFTTRRPETFVTSCSMRKCLSCSRYR